MHADLLKIFDLTQSRQGAKEERGKEKLSVLASLCEIFIFRGAASAACASVL